MRNKRLGRGMEGFFAPSTEEKAETTTSDNVLNTALLQQAHREVTGKGNPVVGVWSERAKTLLRYLVLTTPNFKESTEACELLEVALQEKYPELWNAVGEIT